MPHSKRRTRWYRGSRYHGWGQIGQHRKSGGRGGYGKAGLKKHKRFYMLKYAPTHFGKHGFISYKRDKKFINIADLEKYIFQGVDEINLEELGFNKLLSKGVINKPIKIIVNEASEKAIKKVREAGGEIILLKQAK